MIDNLLNLNCDYPLQSQMSNGNVLNKFISNTVVLNLKFCERKSRKRLDLNDPHKKYLKVFSLKLQNTSECCFHPAVCESGP